MAEFRQEVHFGGRRMRCYAERPPHLTAMIEAAARQRPDAIAVVDGERRVSFAELLDDAARIAGNLVAAGLRSGDRVALLLGNHLAFVQATVACLRAGLVLVPIGIRHREPEVRFVLSHCGARAIVFDQTLREAVPPASAVPDLRHRFAVGDGPPSAGVTPFPALLQPVEPLPPPAVGEEDTCCILYTSGTTGVPKGARLTHLGVIHSCIHYRDCFGLTADDVTVLAVPGSHVTGLVAVILTYLGIGGRCVLLPQFKARDFLAVAAAEGVTMTMMVPAMYNLCLLQPDFATYGLAAWRIGAYGGAPMPEATIRRLAELLPGLHLCNAYGATETTSPATLMPLNLGVTRSDSVGVVVPCGELRVCDEDGRILPAGEAGEVWIAGPMVVPGYWNNPEADALAFQDGFWRSGDIGSLDGEGFLRILDRRKDMINRAGYKVYSAEVENVLSLHPAVVECAVIGHPDPVLGERVHAVVVSQAPSPAVADLQAFCAERLADYKVPETIHFADRPLPRNANGKLLKSEVRRLMTDGPT